MLPSYQLSPLLVLVSFSFHSFILADTQSAGSISAHIDGTLSSQQQQRQRRSEVPSSKFAPIASSYSRGLFQSGDSSDALPFPYDVSSDLQERAAVNSKGGLVLEPRGSPRSVGKKDRTDASESADFNDHARSSRARAPINVGKKRANEEVSSGILTDDHRVEKRSAPRFVGKRASFYAAGGDPFLARKRYIQSRPSINIPSSPYLSAQEFKSNFRRTDPLFAGKRTLDFDEDDFLDKRGAPRFVGKRGAPRFVGKRGAPRFVGKRGAPKFIGKRGPPRFVGKRDQDELDDAPGVSDEVFDGEQHEDGKELLRSLFQNDQSRLASEFLATEISNAERRGLLGLEDEGTDEGVDRR